MQDYVQILSDELISLRNNIAIIQAEQQASLSALLKSIDESQQVITWVRAELSKG